VDVSDTLQAWDHLDGTRFCLVQMEVLNVATQQVKLTPVHGVARVLPDKLVVEEPCGNRLVVPDSALPSILPSDGTAVLEDAEHYVIVRIGRADRS
jgi:hypothetical protein